MNLKELEQYANNFLSSFEGEKIVNPFSSFEGEEIYTGEGDDFLDFGGINRSFANVMDAGRVFVMTLTNTATDSRYAYIIPGYTWRPGSTISGQPIDGAFNDKNAAAGLSGAGSPKTILEFLSFIKSNPTAISMIKVEGTVAAQVSQQLIVTELSPFKSLEERIINLGSYQDQDTYRDKLVAVPTPGLIISDQVRIELCVPASCVTAITFFAGAVLNPAVALESKMNKARATFARAGIETVRQQHQMRLGAGTARSAT